MIILNPAVITAVSGQHGEEPGKPASTNELFWHFFPPPLWCLSVFSGGFIKRWWRFDERRGEQKSKASKWCKQKKQTKKGLSFIFLGSPTDFLEEEDLLQDHSTFDTIKLCFCARKPKQIFNLCYLVFNSSASQSLDTLTTTSLLTYVFFNPLLRTRGKILWGSHELDLSLSSYTAEL